MFCVVRKPSATTSQPSAPGLRILLCLCVVLFAYTFRLKCCVVVSSCCAVSSCWPLRRLPWSCRASPASIWIYVPEDTFFSFAPLARASLAHASHMYRTYTHTHAHILLQRLLHVASTHTHTLKACTNVCCAIARMCRHRFT